DAFKKSHDGKSVEEYLKDRWKDHPDELKPALEALHPGEKIVDPRVVHTALQELKDGQHSLKDDDFDRMNKALAGKSAGELQEMESAFKKEHKGQSIEDYLRDRWKDHPDELKKALDSLHAGQGKIDEASLKQTAQQAAKQIDGAMTIAGSDNYK